MASPSVVLKVVFLLDTGRVAIRTEGTVLRAVGVVSVVVRERDGRAWETRCLPARISTRWRCIICHDTAPHDRADNKQHTRTRHIAHLFTRTRDNWPRSHS